jgi:hypothetical protein
MENWYQEAREIWNGFPKRAKIALAGFTLLATLGGCFLPIDYKGVERTAEHERNRGIAQLRAQGYDVRYDKTSRADYAAPKENSAPKAEENALERELRTLELTKGNSVDM